MLVEDLLEVLLLDSRVVRFLTQVLLVLDDFYEHLMSSLLFSVIKDAALFPFSSGDNALGSLAFLISYRDCVFPREDGLWGNHLYLASQPRLDLAAITEGTDLMETNHKCVTLPQNGTLSGELVKSDHMRPGALSVERRLFLL